VDVVRLAKLTDYAIVILSAFARAPGQLQTAPALARTTGLPLATVAKVLKMLGRGGIVDSTRGSGGGYHLARVASRIGVAAILEVMEGPIALTACCTDGGDRCGIEPGCPVKDHWRRISETVLGALSELTLEDLIQPLPTQRRRPERSPMLLNAASLRR